MAISFSKYVRIVSGVGGSSAAQRRDLGLRVFSTSNALTYGQILVCTSASDVASVFGETSKEYAIASKYFGYISNSITQAQQISFTKWINSSTGLWMTRITAGMEPLEISSFSGRMGLKIKNGTTSSAIVSISTDFDFEDVDYSEVADKFTIAMNNKAQESGYAWLQGSSCSFSNGVFVLEFTDSSSSATQGPDITLEAFTDNSVTDARKAMGLYNYNVFIPNNWSLLNESGVATWKANTDYAVGDYVKNSGTIYCCKVAHTSGSTFSATNWSAKPATVSAWSDTSAYAIGTYVDNGGVTYCCVTTIAAPASGNPSIVRTISVSSETPSAALDRVNSAEDNFGSFMFVEELTDDQKSAVAETNEGYNYKYLDLTFALSATYASTAANLDGYGCTAVTYENRQTEFAEFMPAALFASTDYSRVNSTKTFMFKQFDGINPSVGLKNESGTYGSYAHLYEDLDAKKINYYGETMKSGKPLCFYQNGTCMDGTEISVVCNEIWLKDAIETEIINLLIAMEKVPANSNGIAMIDMITDGVCQEALNNGTFSKAKSLTTTQKAYIDSTAGETDAWKAVYSNGYWKNTVIKQEATSGGVIYKANYTLIYSKGDSIRKVTGSDIMI